MNISTGNVRSTITPDFSHRLSNPDANLGGLVDSVTDFTMQARGILYAIMFSHQEKHAHIAPIDTANAAYAAIHFMDDIDAYLKAFIAAQEQ
ncbi:MAG: hypothetical protein PHC99_04545 [Methylococcales bacterium]|nr:hypothetical protein [Methylococcales bacterium]